MVWGVLVNICLISLISRRVSVMRFARPMWTSAAISLVVGSKRARAVFLPLQLAVLAMALTAAGPAFGNSMSINPTYNTAAMMSAGLSAAEIANVETAFAAAAAQFTNNFNDPININITVTAAA